MRRPRPRQVVLLLALLVLPGCRPEATTVSVPPPRPPSPTSSASPDDATGGSFDLPPAADVRTLRFAIEQDPIGISPGFTGDAEGDLIVDALFDSLTAVGDDLGVVPGAATSWSVSDDLLTWTFVLAPGGRFHDGTAVTATDFVRSFNRIADGTSPMPSLAAPRLAGVRGFAASQDGGVPLEGVQAVDERTLAIDLVRPDADLPRRLGHPTLGPVPQAAALTPLAYNERPVGNGPFQMAADWEHNQFIRLARVPGHPDVPGVDEIVLRIYAGSGAQAVRDLKAGLVDVATIPVSSLASAREQFGRGTDGLVGPGVLDGPSTAIYYLGIDTSRPPFDDVRLRRAMSMVIDRGALVNLAQDSRDVLTALVPPGVPGARRDVCDHCVRDVDAARALVAEVRAGDPEVEGDEIQIPTIVLRHDQGVTNAAIVTEIAEDLRRELDLDVEVAAAPIAEHVTAIAEGRADLFRLGWQGELFLDSFLSPLLQTGSPDNLTRYSRPEVDALLAEAAATLDDAGRAALLQQAEDLALADAPILPIHVYRHRLVVSDEVEGFVLRPNGSVDLTAVRVERDT